MSVLIEAALRSLVLAMLVGSVVLMFRIRNPHIEKTLWGGVLGCALLMPALMRWPPLHPTVLPAAFLSDVVISGRRIAAHAPPAITFAAAYLAIVCGLAARLVAGFVRMWDIRRSAVPVHSSWSEGLDVRVTAALTGPVTFGCVVLLPTDFASWSAAKRTAILAHEREHVRTRDCALQWLAGVHVCIFWFSPLSWWLRHRLAALAEYSSDDAALRAMRNAADYAAVLLEAAHSRCLARTAISMSGAGGMARRMDRVLSGREVSDIPAAWRRALAAALVLPAVALAAGTPGVQAASGPAARVISAEEGTGKWYPERAKREGRNGIVRIAVTLDPNGQFVDSVIVSESPEGFGFADAAAHAARALEYSNPTGHPTTVVFDVKFELQDQWSWAAPTQRYGTTNFEGH